MRQEKKKEKTIKPKITNRKQKTSTNKKQKTKNPKNKRKKKEKNRIILSEFQRENYDLF